MKFNLDAFIDSLLEFMKFDLTAFICSLLIAAVAFFVGGIGAAMLTMAFSYIAFLAYEKFQTSKYVEWWIAGVSFVFIASVFSLNDAMILLTFVLIIRFFIWSHKQNLEQEKIDIQNEIESRKNKLKFLSTILKEENAREIFDGILKDEFVFDQEIIEAFDLDNPDINFLISRYKYLNFESGKIGKNCSVLEMFAYQAFRRHNLDYFGVDYPRNLSDNDAIGFVNQMLLCLAMRTILVADCIKPTFDKYSKALIRKHSQLDVKDDYGDSRPDLWVKELEWFYKNKIEREIKELQAKNLPTLDFLFANKQVYFLVENGFDEKNEGELFNFGTHYLWNLVIDSKLTKEFVEGEDDLQYCENMGGLEYEEFIKNCFIKNGCEAQVTKASGDQGVDVVAEIGDKRIAVQCKHYNSKVSNDAIQQVYSAKNFFDCDIAVVISNNNFTNQAKQLASKLGVYLLHHEDVEGFVKEIAWY